MKATTCNNLPELYKEKTPLKEKTSIAIFERVKKTFSFPIHVHDVYELNFVENADHAERIIGNTKEKITSKDLVLICNPSLEHAWQDGETSSNQIHEITIQFSPDSIPQQLLDSEECTSIKRMFKRAANGLVFSESVTERVSGFLQNLTIETDNFMLKLKFWMLLYTLSSDNESRELIFNSSKIETDSIMEKFKLYIRQNIHSQIVVKDVSTYLGMSTSTFSRFIKNATGMSFSTYLLEYRLESVLRELNSNNDSNEVLSIDTLVEKYGFISIPYFYKVFKRRTDMTPAEYQRKRRKSLIRMI